MKSFIILILSGMALAAPEFPIYSEKITPELKIALKTKGHANIFVTMNEDTSQVLANIVAARFETRDDKLNTMHSMLVDHARISQRNLVNYLSSVENLAFETLWISNQLYVREAKADIVDRLASFSEVKSIDEEFFATLIEAVEIRNATRVNQFEWGVLKIQAPEAWEEIGGNGGKGIRVGTVDTGVRLTHEALKNNFLGEYGWHDPSTKEPLPTDNNGHGTHVTGTIAGQNKIGVAPNATWMACRGCASSACSQFDLSRCGQFFACPTLADGSTKPDCSKAPHVVSNSWGGGRGATWYNPVISAWKVAGIIPVFSIGNNGPNCNTANSPGDHPDVIGVGSTMENDGISQFSSIGPTSDRRMKPDITAPGSLIVSSYHLADDAYRALSGTSMAAPHVSGSIALLLTRDNNLTIEDVRRFLFGNTDRELEFSGRICEDVGDNNFPNHVFGNGRLNALKSASAQTKTLRV